MFLFLFFFYLSIIVKWKQDGLRINSEIKNDSGCVSENAHFSLLILLFSLVAVQTLKPACPPLFVSVVNKITPIFPSNAGAFHFSREGWGQWIRDSFSILAAN